MYYFPASEKYNHLDLILGLEKLSYMALLELVIMFISLRPEFDLFENNRSLFLFRNMLTFSLFIFILAVIHYSANRRYCFRRNLNKIEIVTVCSFKCNRHCHDSQLLTIRCYYSYAVGNYLLVNSYCFFIIILTYTGLPK